MTEFIHHLWPTLQKRNSKGVYQVMQISVIYQSIDPTIPQVKTIHGKYMGEMREHRQLVTDGLYKAVDRANKKWKRKQQEGYEVAP